MKSAAILQIAIAAATILISSAADPPPRLPTGYNNHTVGGDDGWFFNSTTNTSSANYSSWASSQSFNLGDFLIFPTNSNQTIIQTFNESTFRSCSVDNSSDDDTFQYLGGAQHYDEALTVLVPLTIEGPNYYFSDANDGVQCENGLAFEIQVNRGLGLPPSLNQPPPPAYREPPGPGDEQSPPIAIAGGTPDLDNGAAVVGSSGMLLAVGVAFWGIF
ncbi:hypothetical protein LINPERHAP1_LOCUS19821 [Linum perenne]